MKSHIIRNRNIKLFSILILDHNKIRSFSSILTFFGLNIEWLHYAMSWSKSKNRKLDNINEVILLLLNFLFMKQRISSSKSPAWMTMTIVMTLLCCNDICSQTLPAADTLNKKRVKHALIGATATYGVAAYGMYKSWYEDSERTGLHSFDDWNEWNNMDKYGHMATSQYQSYLAYRGARWCGYTEKKATIIGAGTSLLLQTTIEVMDGFSEKWGFSWSDMAFNTAGAGLFVVQQRAWGEQRIRLKMNAFVKTYSTSLIRSQDDASISSLEKRADDLFGKAFYERLLKDYNQQTYWISVNLSSFTSAQSSLPRWLNVAAGIGAEDMFGGFQNSWEEDGHVFELSRSRYSQFYLSPDVDWTRIKTNSKLLRTVFDLMSVIKLPLPGLEYSSRDQLRWRWLL
jgi:uncharacterized protein YfiM (DUF2279 family)